MKCPYCNNDMIPGYVQNGRRLVWDTEKLDGAYLPFTEKGRFVTRVFSRTRKWNPIFVKTVISYCHFWKNDEYGAYDLGRIESVAGGLGVAVMTLGRLV